MVAQTALRPPPGRRSTTEEPTTKSVNSVEETNTGPSEGPPTVPTEPSVVLDPVTNLNDSSADISQPNSSDDDTVPEEIGSGHADSSDSSDLEHTNEKQDSNDIGQSLLDQDDSVFEKDNKTEIPTITEQSDPSVVVTKPLHGSDKERQCSKTTSQVRHHDLHRQELKLLDERLNNLTLALESTRNFRQLVSIMVKNFVFHTTIFVPFYLQNCSLGPQESTFIAIDTGASIFLTLFCLSFGPFCYFSLKRLKDLPTTKEITSALAVHLNSVEDMIKNSSFGILNQNAKYSDDMDARLDLSKVNTFGSLPRPARNKIDPRYLNTGARPKCLSNVPQIPSRASDRFTLENIELGVARQETLPSTAVPGLTSPPSKPLLSVLKEKSKLAWPKMPIRRFRKRP